MRDPRTQMIHRLMLKVGRLPNVLFLILRIVYKSVPIKGQFHDQLYDSFLEKNF